MPRKIEFCSSVCTVDGPAGDGRDQISELLDAVLLSVLSTPTMSNSAAGQLNVLTRTPAAGTGFVPRIGRLGTTGTELVISRTPSCYRSCLSSPSGQRFSRRGGAACSTNPRRLQRGPVVLPDEGCSCNCNWFICAITNIGLKLS